MSKPFILQFYNPLTNEIPLIPYKERCKLDEEVLESWKKEYKLDKNEVLRIKKALADRTMVEYLLLTMSNLMMGNFPLVDMEISESILKEFGILNPDKVMKILFDTAKDNIELLNKYWKACQNKSDKILELEKACMEARKQKDAYCTVVHDLIVQKEEKDMEEHGITVPESIKVIKDMESPKGTRSISYWQTLRKNMQDYLKEKKCESIVAGGSVGNFYKIYDVAKAAEKYHGEYSLKTYIIDMEASNKKIPWIVLKGKYEKHS